MKLIQITDTHLTPAGDTLYDLPPRRRLEACLADILDNHDDADLCVITGDLTHKGEPGAYAALREVLDGFPIPLQLLLGNHDDRPAFRAAFPEVPVDGNGFVQSVRETPEGVLVFLDTKEPGTGGGVLCAGRRAWLADRLQAAAGRDVFLFLHHPPLYLHMPHFGGISLQEPEALGALLSAHGRVRHIFFGHMHRPISGSWNGIPFSTQRGTSHQVALNFDDTRAVFSEEPPAYGVILIAGGNVVVHQHDFLDRGRRFNPRSMEPRPRGPRYQRSIQA